MLKHKIVRKTIRPFVLGLVAIEKQIFFYTGKRLRALSGYWEYRSRRIQEELDAEHDLAAA